MGGTAHAKNPDRSLVDIPAELSEFLDIAFTIPTSEKELPATPDQFDFATYWPDAREGSGTYAILIQIGAREAGRPYREWFVVDYAGGLNLTLRWPNGIERQQLL